MKYGEELDLSEYVHSLFIAYVEAEWLAVEVRVFQAKSFWYSEFGGQSIWLQLAW